MPMISWKNLMLTPTIYIFHILDTKPKSQSLYLEVG